MTTPARPIALEDVRCPKCHKLLARMEPGALKPGQLLEIKCGGCKAHATWIGDEPDSQ